jgi:hypothetical protein
MKCTYRFVQSAATVTCALPSGRRITVPVIPGILKHPSPEMLPMLLSNPNVVRKYTVEALRKAAWPILTQFSKSWLRECLESARLKPSRHRALTFLLS